SGPAVIPKGSLAAVGMGNSVTAPAVVIRPILLPSSSVNQRAPSGPAVIPQGVLAAVGTGNSLVLCAAAKGVRSAIGRTGTISAQTATTQAVTTRPPWRSLVTDLISHSSRPGSWARVASGAEAG